MNGRTLLYIIGAAVLLTLTACNKQTVYYHYEHTPVSGWEKNDTLTFLTAPIAVEGHYAEDVGLRISGDYPFIALNLIVEQTVLKTPTSKLKTQTSNLVDTLTCNLIDEMGNAKGNGISHYQYTFPLTTLSLAQGDRLRITIRHDMKREILPGITDIGIRLTKEK